MDPPGNRKPGGLRPPGFFEAFLVVFNPSLEPLALKVLHCLDNLRLQLLIIFGLQVDIKGELPAVQRSVIGNGRAIHCLGPFRLCRYFPATQEI
jgi:hypothetical protein